MYSLASLDRETRNFIENINFSNKGSSNLVSLVLGKLLADNSSLPSSPLNKQSISGYRMNFEENSQLVASNFFRTNYELGINKILDIINEWIVLDIKAVKDYAVIFYSTRYNIVYPSTGLFITSQERAIPDFFFISKSISEATLDEIKNNPIEVCRLYNCFSNLLKSSIFNEVN